MDIKKDILRYTKLIKRLTSLLEKILQNQKDDVYIKRKLRRYIFKTYKALIDIQNKNKLNEK